METNTFTCKGCGHELPDIFIMRTPNYCYMCDPAVTVDELLAEFDKSCNGNCGANHCDTNGCLERKRYKTETPIELEQPF